MSEVAEPTPEPEVTPEPETPTPEQDDDSTSDDDDSTEEDDEADREMAKRFEIDEGQEEKERLDSQRSDESETEGETRTPLPAPPTSPLSYEELDTLADAGELTESSLQATLNSYAQAIKEEYEQSLSQQDDLTNVEGYTRDFFKKNVHSAAAQIVWLANNAESESVKLKAATTVIHEALADSSADGDPIKNLLAELTAQPTSPSPDS